MAEITWSLSYDGDDDEDAEPTTGVREPRRPRTPNDQTGASLDLPRHEPGHDTTADYVVIANG